MNRGVNFGKAAEQLARSMDAAFDHLVSQPINLELPEALKNIDLAKIRKLENKEAK